MDTLKGEQFAERYLWEHAPVAALLIDDDGKIARASAYAAELTGSDPRGRALTDLLVDFAHAPSPDEMVRNDAGGHLVNVTTPQGPPKTLYVHAARCEDGVLLLGAADSRELDAMQQKLLELNAELGDLSRRLQKTNAELARANELKNRFLGMAAHDLRKPAGVIVNFAELILDDLGGDVSDEQREFLDFIHEAGEEMVRLIEDFLDVSTIESGRLRLDRAPVNLREVIESALRYVEPHARRKGVELVRRIPDDLPPVNADAGKLGQVIANLAGNAVEHSEPGAKVFLDARADDDAVTARVTDQGPGFDPEEVEKLFEPYRTGSGRKTEGESSTGLGLAIAHKIVTEHGGRLWVDADAAEDPKLGAVLCFRIPTTESRAETPQ